MCKNDRVCVHPSEVCDGIVHCHFSMDDEMYCKVEFIIHLLRFIKAQHIGLVLSFYHITMICIIINSYKCLFLQSTTHGNKCPSGCTCQGYAIFCNKIDLDVLTYLDNIATVGVIRNTSWSLTGITGVIKFVTEN